MLGVGEAGPVGRAGGMDGSASDGPSPGPGSATTPDPYDAERDAWTVLATVDDLGPVAFGALLARYGSGRAILVAAGEPGGVARLADTPRPDGGEGGRRPVPASVATSLVQALDHGQRILGRTRDLGIRVMTVEEPAYPRRLTTIAMPPHVLFVRGDAAAMGRLRAVAVVGTRRATSHGRATAGRIAGALVGAGAAVVSGLAYGIDGAAHEATIRAGGTTVAVIGGGHARAIPSGHDRLAEAIVETGGAIVSELAPDVVPTRGTFPRRNRIISGSADATVVVEAPARSGALITASWALEQGRDCFLVPGALDAPASAGCIAFLREFQGAARIVAGIPQLIADLGLQPASTDGVADGLVGAVLGDLGGAGKQVATGLVQGLTTVDELVAATDLPVAAVLATLTLLERRGLTAGLHGRYRPAGALLGEVVTPKPR